MLQRMHSNVDCVVIGGAGRISRNRCKMMSRDQKRFTVSEVAASDWHDVMVAQRIMQLSLPELTANEPAEQCREGAYSLQIYNRLNSLNLFSVKFTYTRSLVPLFSVKGYRSLYRVRVSFR